MHAMVLKKLRTALEWTELADRLPGPGEIRVAVTACGVCRTDLHVVDGELPDPKLPIIPGHEIVGRIDMLGSGVEGFKIGERVGIPWLGHICGVCPYCMGGQENLCDHPLFTGYTRDGGFATATIADVGFALPLGEVGSDASLAPLLWPGRRSRHCEPEPQKGGSHFRLRERWVSRIGAPDRGITKGKKCLHRPNARPAFGLARDHFSCVSSQDADPKNHRHLCQCVGVKTGWQFQAVEICNRAVIRKNLPNDGLVQFIVFNHPEHRLDNSLLIVFKKDVRQQFRATPWFKVKHCIQIIQV